MAPSTSSCSDPLVMLPPPLPMPCSSDALVRPTVACSRGIIKVDLNATDVGAGILALYNWLVEVRSILASPAAGASHGLLPWGAP